MKIRFRRRLGCKRKDNIKMTLRKEGLRMWTKLNCLRVWPVDGLL
jgi:hypothetical protein